MNFGRSRSRLPPNRRLSCGYPGEPKLHARISEPWLRHRYAPFSEMLILLWAYIRAQRSIDIDVVIAIEWSTRQALRTTGSD
jgi:hypothetical protein